MADHMQHEEGSEEEFEELAFQYDVALMTTIGPDGHLRSRPMAMQRDQSDGHEFFFAAWADSEKVHDLEHDPRCALAFHDGHDSVYLSVSGHAELIRDKAQIREKWDESWKPWFPEGPEGHDVALIRFVPEHAEYVNPRGGKLKVAVEILKALMTHEKAQPGPKYEVDLGAEHVH